MTAAKRCFAIIFFDSAREPRSLVIAHQFHMGFSVVVVLHSYVMEYAFVKRSQAEQEIRSG